MNKWNTGDINEIVQAKQLEAWIRRMAIGRERVRNIQLTFKNRMAKIWYQMMEYVQEKTD